MADKILHILLKFTTKLHKIGKICFSQQKTNYTFITNKIYVISQQKIIVPAYVVVKPL